MAKKGLTIGIPTYDRCDAIGALLNRIVDAGINRIEDVEILVIDDDSPDGTFSRIEKYSGAGGIRVLTNPTRLGFQGNFLNVIAECDTEYVLYMADDDLVIEEGIRQLLQYIAAIPVDVALISSLFYRSGSIYRGNDKEIRLIGLAEFQSSCSHLPGIVLNKRLAMDVIDKLKPFLLDDYNVYPQCCIALMFLIQKLPCVYVPFEVARTGLDLPSRLTGYQTITGRWRQFLFFAEFMEHIAAMMEAPDEAERALALLEQHKRSLFRLLGAGIRAEAPEYAEYYLEGAKDVILRRR